MAESGDKNGTRQLRVGLVSIPDASDVTTWSGIPFQILNQLRAQGVHVEVYSPLHSKMKYALAPAKLMARIRGKSLSLDHFQVVLDSYAKQISALLLSRPVDVVVSTSTIPITRLECQQPIVVWADAVFHSMYEYYGNAFSNLTNGALIRARSQEEEGLERCAIAAYSSSWAAESAKQLTDPRKVRILPFGSSLPVQHSKKDIAISSKEKRALRPKRCELLFVGVNWERKGGDLAVETARLLNDAGIKTTLRVVGSVPPGSLPDFVISTGFINKSTAEGMRRFVELFQAADFFILPTKAEAAGIVFSEANSFGVPSLTYATGGVQDYVLDGISGVCLTPGSTARDFAVSIEAILANSEMYERLSLNAFMEYKNRLNWEESVRQLINLCEECKQR